VNQSELIRKKTEKTNLIRWKCKSPTQSKEVREKMKKNNLEKWGVECTLSSDIVKEKSKKTIMEKWGVEHNFMVPEIIEKRKSTYLENWGVDNPSKSEEIKDKKRRTSTKNWGVDNPSKSEEIKDKKRRTSLLKWGTEQVLSSDIIRDKSKQTLIRNWGVDHNMKVREVVEKMNRSNLVKWGVEWTLQSSEIRQNITKTNLKKFGVDHLRKSEDFRKMNMILCTDPNYLEYIGENISIFNCDKGHVFKISSSNYYSRKGSNLPLCTVCNPIGNSQSIKEKELFNYIESIYSGEIIKSYRDGLEIDIYLPHLKLGFEFNGLYWHSDEWKDKNYHLNKTNHFKERGIRIIHIWEDDWVLKSGTVKSQIRNWIGLTEKRIFARKCEVKLIDCSKICNRFLNENHIQGSVNSVLKLGLYHNGELVSLMTFDHFEGRKKMQEGGWNLSRFCNKLDTNVVGGASKILKHFITNYNPKRIISYADKDWSEGLLYEKIGFTRIHETKPDYKYILNEIRVHKSRFRKSRLNTELSESQEMRKSHIKKIWDCGKIKFEIKFNRE
jgi:hypothetical protein